MMPTDLAAEPNLCASQETAVWSQVGINLLSRGFPDPGFLRTYISSLSKEVNNLYNTFNLSFLSWKLQLGEIWKDCVVQWRPVSLQMKVHCWEGGVPEKA